MEKSHNNIIEYIRRHPLSPSKEIHEGADIDIGYATLKRVLKKLNSSQYIDIIGKGKGTKYKLSPSYSVIRPVDIDFYFQKEIDEREIIESFNIDLIRGVLSEVSLFTTEESDKLDELHTTYSENIKQLSKSQFDKELERLAIDLSWKSSQIEGNTYSLLEMPIGFNQMRNHKVRSCL